MPTIPTISPSGSSITTLFVIKNVAHLCKQDRSKTCGKDGRKKVVCIGFVSDNRAKANLRVLSVRTAECVAKKDQDRRARQGLREQVLLVIAEAEREMRASDKREGARRHPGRHIVVVGQ